MEWQSAFFLRDFNPDAKPSRALQEEQSHWVSFLRREYLLSRSQAWWSSHGMCSWCRQMECRWIVHSSLWYSNTWWGWSWQRLLNAKEKTQGSSTAVVPPLKGPSAGQNYLSHYMPCTISVHNMSLHFEHHSLSPDWFWTLNKVCDHGKSLLMSNTQLWDTIHLTSVILSLDYWIQAQTFYQSQAYEENQEPATFTGHQQRAFIKQVQVYTACHCQWPGTHIEPWYLLRNSNILSTSWK